VKLRTLLPLCPALAFSVLAWGDAAGEAKIGEEIVEEPAPESGFRLPLRIDQDPTEELALTSNEPTYLVIGGKGDSTGKLQFSFQYRMFDEDSDPVEAWPWLEKMHFAYTQTSVWDLLGSSNPFKDITYRPSLYWQQVEAQEGRSPDFWRIGYEHESNGKAEDESRSLDSFFIHSGWFFQTESEHNLILASKIYLPFNTSANNEDIHDYRGYVDFNILYGRPDSWGATATLRQGSKGGSAEIALSLPLREPVFARTGGYLYMQVFHGYGETLLEYNENVGTLFRVGLAIVR